MKRVKDERIAKEANKIFARTYFLLLSLTVVEVAIKLFFDRTFALYLPEIIGSGVSFLFLLIRYTHMGVLFRRDTDERIEDFKIRTKGMCHVYCFVVYLISGVVMLLFYPDNIAALGSFFIWIIPAGVMSHHIIKNGLLAWGSNQSKKRGIMTFRVGVPIASLFFGVFMAWFTMDNETLWQTVLHACILALLWGIPFYFGMTRMFMKSDKNANQQLTNAENECDDSKHEEY